MAVKPRARIPIMKAANVRKNLTNAQSKRVNDLYTKAAKRLGDEITALEQLQETTATMQRLGQITRIQKQVSGELTAISKTIESELPKTMLEAAKAVTSVHGQWALEAGMPQLGMNAAYSSVPTQTVNHIVSGGVWQGKPWTLSNAIWGNNQQILNTVDNIIADGLINNSPVLQIAQALEHYVQPGKKKPWEWSNVYPASDAVIDYNAQRLVRTLISAAYRDTNTACIMDNPFVEAEQWVVSNSHRVCGVCVDIQNSDNFDLGPGVYPKGEAPYDHPNGMCILIPIIPMSMTEIGDRLADWVLGNDSSSNITDEALTAYYNALWG